MNDNPLGFDNEFIELFKETKTQKKAREIRTKISYEKEVTTQEKLLLQYKRLAKDNPIDLHFAYMGLIDVYYRQRDTKEDALKLCIEYCKKD